MTYHDKAKNKAKNKAKIAIILVPAIGASNLYPNGKKNGNSGYAPDYAWLMRIYMKDSQAIANDLRKNALKWKPWTGDSSGWNQVHQGTYQAFLQDCQTYSQFPFEPLVYAIGYNFFQSNLKSADTILQRTEQILKESKADGFIYITHSMGALPVRAAFRKVEFDRRLQKLDEQHDNPSFSFIEPLGNLVYQKCIGVIHVAAPNLGAPEAYLRFHRGVSRENAGLAERFVLGKDGFGFTVQSCFIPSMCEILPVGQYANETIESANPNKSGIYALHNSLLKLAEDSLDKSKTGFDGINGLDKEVCLRSLEQNLHNAHSFHDFLGDYIFPRTKVVVLLGNKTVQSVTTKLEPRFTYDDGEETFDDGDGTVTEKSQKAYVENEDIREITPNNKKLTHGSPFKELGKTEGVFDAIYDLLIDLFKTHQTKINFNSDEFDSTLSSQSFSLGMDKQPIFVNGEKVIFDKAVATTPVTIEPKTTHR
ncbi:MAG: hypothetical protein F6K21_33425 [Symploca sp. SIO2D2]|nr:hypothetical protein [Symploca sp. SIO2D2]